MQRMTQRPVEIATTNVHAPAANTAAVVTFAAVAEKRHYLTYVAFSYSGAPTGGRLTIEDGAGNVVFDVAIIAGGPGSFQFANPKRGEINTALIVTLAAGGAGISGKLNAYKFTDQ